MPFRLKCHWGYINTGESWADCHNLGQFSFAVYTEVRNLQPMKGAMTETETLKALRGNAREQDRAVRALFVDDPRPFNLVKKFVLRMNGSVEDAEEVFDDAVVALCQNINNHAFEQRSKLMSYFFKIAQNLWFQLYRKRHPTLPLSNHEFELTETTVPDSEHLESLYELLEYGLGQLEEHQREMLRAKYLNDMSMKEIAETYELSNENIAKKYVHRFRQYLLDRIKKHPLYEQIISKNP